MIERHYFRNRLIKSFDFTFPFCPPGSTNTWYSEYELPPMDQALSAYTSYLAIVPIWCLYVSMLSIYVAASPIWCSCEHPVDLCCCLCVGTVVNKIVKRPFETESDSFYFVGNELIMHNKARYK